MSFLPNLVCSCYIINDDPRGECLPDSGLGRCIQHLFLHLRLTTVMIFIILAVVHIDMHVWVHVQRTQNSGQTYICTIDPWNVVNGRLPGSGHLPRTLRYIIIMREHYTSALQMQGHTVHAHFHFSKANVCRCMVYPSSPQLSMQSNSQLEKQGTILLNFRIYRFCKSTSYFTLKSSGAHIQQWMRSKVK